MSVITDGADGNDKHDKYNHDDDVEDLCGVLQYNRDKT